MAWYKTGSVSVNQGDTFVTGLNTRFAANSRVGDGIRGPDGKWYEVVNIASETVLGIFPAYEGVSISNATNYTIAPLQGYNKETADRLRAITDQIHQIDEDVVRAETAADAAQSSETAALQSKNAASTSETNAANSATSAINAKNSAVTAQGITEQARDVTLAATAGVIANFTDLGSVSLTSGNYPSKHTTSAFWKVNGAGYVTIGGVTTIYRVGDLLVYSKPLDQFYKIENALHTVKIAIIGDSITQPSVRNNDWGKQTADIIEKFTGVPVLLRNAAIAGANFSTALNVKEHRGGTTSQVEEVIAFQPELVIVALGINDMIYSSLFTQAQVIANAQAVVNALKAGIPNVKIIYCEETPHDVVSAGVIPTALTNKDTVPPSHNTLVINGFGPCRINNSSYLNTALSSQKLTAHQLWGNATTAIRAMFDGWFSANLWKMSRLGGYVDAYHVDELSHTRWAWQVINYLATSTITIPGVNFSRLNIKDLSTNVNTSIDTSYSESLAYTASALNQSFYRGYNMFKRMDGWMLRAVGANMVCESGIASAVQHVPVRLENLLPGSSVYYSVDTTNFATTGRTVNTDGSVNLLFYPDMNAGLSLLRVAGTHTLYIAVVAPDASVDVFQQVITVANNYIPVGSTSLRYLTSEPSLTPNAGATYINWNAGDHDDLGVGLTGTAFTIPAALNGRKVRLRANIRVAVPLTNADTTNCWVNAAIWKNRTAPPGNSVASGRGLPSQNMILTSGGIFAPAFDLSLCGATITVATGDVFELVAALSKTSVDNAYVKAHSVTWFEIELVN